MTDIRQGDCRELLKAMDAGSVHCAVTSPPYWGLREYDVGDENKPLMIGLESTLDEWLERMVEVFREVRRVLRDDGTLWVNIGDAYSGNHARGGPSVKQDSNAGAGAKFSGQMPLGSKQLLGMPWRLAFALQADGWYLRSEIIWAKPGPMPESGRCSFANVFEDGKPANLDRPTKSHEQIFLLSKRPRYFYDAEAVKTNGGPGWRGSSFTSGYDVETKPGLGMGQRHETPGANLRDVWTMPTQGFSQAHFATFPIALPARCIMAGTSDKGCCPACGKPWRRVVSKEGGTLGEDWHPDRDGLREGQYGGTALSKGWTDGGYAVRTLRWEPSCDCDAGDPVPCVVLDPFCGSGATGVACRQLGRDFIGLELSPTYCEMARRRISNPNGERAVEDVSGQLTLEL